MSATAVTTSYYDIVTGNDLSRNGEKDCHEHARGCTEGNENDEMETDFDEIHPPNQFQTVLQYVFGQQEGPYDARCRFFS